ncbi:MAG: ABC transporter permease [Saprospiraceae bacterium]
MSKQSVQPPKIAERFLRWFCSEEVLETLLGDLYEIYERRFEESPKWKADLFFFRDVIDVCRPFAWRKRKIITHNYTIMFQHNFKIASRSLFKNKSFALINIGGLAMGIMVPLMIGLWMLDEFNFNTQFENADNIAAVYQNQNFNGKTETWNSQAIQLEPELRNNYSQYFKYITTTRGISEQLLIHEDRKVNRNGAYFGPDITEILSLKMLKGSRNALQEPNALLLAASTAEALFKDQDPMNKTVKINNELEVTVKGVYEDIPANSSFGDLRFIAPFELHVEHRNLRERTGWGNSWFNTYVQIADNADMAEVEKAIEKVKYDNIDPTFAQKSQPILFLHPMKDWYLRGIFKDGFNQGGRIQYVFLFGIIALFILLLACINFVNLSTARSEKRAKEVGIRKTLGSLRSHLIGQFYSESVLIAMLSLAVCLILMWFLLPTFNNMAGKELDIPWSQPLFWIITIGFTLFTGLAAGSYPAFYLSAFQPIKALKRSTRSIAFPRKVMVVVQFTVSISLIIATITVYQQIQHAQNRPIGYDRDNLLSVRAKNQKAKDSFTSLRSELLNLSTIEEVAATDSRVTLTYSTNGGFDWEGKDPDKSNDFTSLRVSHEFGEMVNWDLISGRDFSRAHGMDENAIILNEAAVEYMGIENPVGKALIRDIYTYPIVGVVKNLITQSPYEPVRQTIFMLEEDWFNYLYIKLKPESKVQEALAGIEGVMAKYDPINTFEYEFTDEAYAKKFNNEKRIGRLASFFTILAIFISCLGLFGLATYVAEQRTKEIGIRKVLGASVFKLWQMLSKDFVVLVSIAFIIAIPIAYFLMQKWLVDYTYRINIGWWVFGLVGILAVLITLFTVSFQALKVAFKNPVQVIKEA